MAAVFGLLLIASASLERFESIKGLGFAAQMRREVEKALAIRQAMQTIAKAVGANVYFSLETESAPEAAQ